MILDFELSGNEYKLLSYMNLNNNMIVYTSAWDEYVGSVSREVHMSYRTVQRTIEKLLKKGFIQKTWNGIFITEEVKMT